jgi:hypothetical protein
MMKPLSANSLENLVIGMAGFSGAIIVGALFAGSAVFHWQNPAFQYVTYGAAVSALYVGWKERGILESITYALTLGLYWVIFSSDNLLGVFTETALFFLFVCLLFHVVWNVLGHRLVFGKFLILGLAFALFQLVETAVVMYSLPRQEFLLISILRATLFGTLGLGVGVGIESAEIVRQVLFPHHHSRLRALTRWVPRRFHRK